MDEDRDKQDQTRRGVMGCLVVVAAVAMSIAVGIGMGAAWGWATVAAWSVALLARMAVVA